MKILLVDDNKLILTILKEYLEEIPGISSIFICNDPKKVKAIIDDNDIDILLLDIIMPEISGLDLLKMLRDDEQYDDMPIIMLTALDDTESYIKCFELGAFDYISKPINAVEFNARLKVAMEAKDNSNHLKSLVTITQKQNEELKSMNEELKAAKFQLVQNEKMAAIGQLAAGIAHEINNPMGYVNSNYEILHRYFQRISDFLSYLKVRMVQVKKENSEDTEFIGHLQEKLKDNKIDLILNELESILNDSEHGIQRVTEIVQSLRIFTRSAKDEEKAFYPLTDLINQVVLISRNEFKYHARVSIDVPSDIMLYCNRIQLGQVLVNILVNASQAIKSENRKTMGLIKISARKEHKKIQLQIYNDGPNISEDSLNRIFDPFYTTKEVGQGTGLGLSITYDIIVNKHSGSIEAANDPTKGVIFTILLPEIEVE